MLLIVVAIIAIMAVIVEKNINGQGQNSIDQGKSAIQKAEDVKNAVENKYKQLPTI